MLQWLRIHLSMQGCGFNPWLGTKIPQAKKKPTTPFIRNKLLPVQASAFLGFPAFCNSVGPPLTQSPGFRCLFLMFMVELASQRGRQYGAEVKGAVMEQVGISASSTESLALLTCLLNFRAPPVKGGDECLLPDASGSLSWDHVCEVFARCTPHQVRLSPRSRAPVFSGGRDTGLS